MALMLTLCLASSANGQHRWGADYSGIKVGSSALARASVLVQGLPDGVLTRFFYDDPAGPKVERAVSDLLNAASDSKKGKMAQALRFLASRTLRDRKYEPVLVVSDLERKRWRRAISGCSTAGWPEEQRIVGLAVAYHLAGSEVPAERRAALSKIRAFQSGPARRVAENLRNLSRRLRWLEHPTPDLTPVEIIR